MASMQCDPEAPVHLTAPYEPDSSSNHTLNTPMGVELHSTNDYADFPLTSLEPQTDLTPIVQTTPYHP